MNRPATLDRSDSANRVVVASCSAYEDSARVAELLVAEGVPAAAVTIDGLRLRRADGLGSERAPSHEASAGALGGVITGAVVGFLFGVLGWVEPLGELLALTLLGALVGAFVGAAAGTLLSFAPPRSASASLRLQAGTYTVVVEHGFTDQAAGILRRAPRSAAARPSHDRT